MNSSCAKLSLALTVLFASQVVLSAVLHSSEDTNDERVSNDDSKPLKSYQNDSQNAGKLDGPIGDRIIYREEIKKEIETPIRLKEVHQTSAHSGASSDSGSDVNRSIKNELAEPNVKDGSLLDSLLDLINVSTEESPETSVVKNHKKRDYPNDYDTSEYYGRGSNRYSYPNRHQPNRMKPFYDRRDDDDSDDEESEYEHDDSEYHEDDEEHHEHVDDEDDDETDAVKPTNIREKGAKGSKAKKPVVKAKNPLVKQKEVKEIIPDIGEVNPIAMMAFTNFLDTLMASAQLQDNPLLNKTTKSIIDNTPKQPQILNHNIERKPVNDTLLEAILGNDRIDVVINPAVVLESEVNQTNEKVLNGESRVARNVVDKDRDISLILDQLFVDDDDEDPRVFTHKRSHDSVPVEQGDEETIHKLYSDFQTEQVMPNFPYAYGANDEVDFNYHYPTMKGLLPAYKKQCESESPYIVMHVHDLADVCHDERPRNYQQAYNTYNTLDYAPVMKYKRDLDRVETQLEDQIDTTNEMTPSIKTEELPESRQYIYESLNLHAVPVFAVYPDGQVPLNYPSRPLNKINDIFEHTDPIKNRIEAIPTIVITHLVNDFMDRVPTHRSQNIDQDGVVVNVYKDVPEDTPKLKQKRDLRGKSERNDSVPDMNESSDATTMHSMENLIASKLAESKELTNGSLSETDRRALCRDIVVKVLSNISDEHVMEQVIENYGSRSTDDSEVTENTELQCNGYDTPICCGEANDDFEKTFINIKNLNIFYEFGESGQNCINMPNKRVQYTVPKHGMSGPAARRPIPFRNPIQEHIKSNKTIKTTKNIKEQINVIQPHHTMIHEINVDTIESHHKSNESNEIPLKSENLVDEIDQSAEESRKIETYTGTDGADDTIYSYHNVTSLVADEPSSVRVYHVNDEIEDKQRSEPVHVENNEPVTTDHKTNEHADLPPDISSAEENEMNFKTHPEIPQEHQTNGKVGDDATHDTDEETENSVPSEQPIVLALHKNTEDHKEEHNENVTSSDTVKNNVEVSEESERTHNNTPVDVNTEDEDLEFKKDELLTEDNTEHSQIEDSKMLEKNNDTSANENENGHDKSNVTELHNHQMNHSSQAEEIGNHDQSDTLHEIGSLSEVSEDKSEDKDEGKRETQETTVGYGNMKYDSLVYKTHDDKPAEIHHDEVAADGAKHENTPVQKYGTSDKSYNDGSCNIPDYSDLENDKHCTPHFNNTINNDTYPHHKTDTDNVEANDEVHETESIDKLNDEVETTSDSIEHPDNEDERNADEVNDETAEEDDDNNDAEEHEMNDADHKPTDNLHEISMAETELTEDERRKRGDTIDDNENEDEADDEDNSENDDQAEEEDHHDEPEEVGNEDVEEGGEKHEMGEDDNNEADHEDGEDAVEDPLEESDESDSNHENKETDNPEPQEDQDLELQPEESIIHEVVDHEHVQETENDHHETEEDLHEHHMAEQVSESDHHLQAENHHDNNTKIHNQSSEEESVDAEGETTDEEEAVVEHVDNDDQTEESAEVTDTGDIEDDTDDSGDSGKDVTDEEEDSVEDEGTDVEQDGEEESDNEEENQKEIASIVHEHKNDRTKSDSDAAGTKNVIENQLKEEGDNTTQIRQPKSANDDVYSPQNPKIDDEHEHPSHQEHDAEYVRKCDVEKLIIDILESKPHPDHNIRHKDMSYDKHMKPDKKYKELVKDIASYFAKKNITSGDDICVYEEYGSKRGDDDVIILSGTKLYQNGITKKDGQNFNLIIKKPHDTETAPSAYDYVEYRANKDRSKKEGDLRKHKPMLTNDKQIKTKRESDNRLTKNVSE